METKYFPVDILVFRNATRDIPFDIYLQLSEDNFAHVFSKSTGLDYKRLAGYIQKGVRTLFVRNDCKEEFEKFLANSPDRILSDPSVPQERKVAVLLNVTEQNMAELFSQLNISAETYDRTQVVMKNFVKLMVEHPKTLVTILKLVSHGEYLYYHSIAVSIFSMFIARSMGKYDEATIEMIGLGGFLHDIGYTQLPRGVMETAPEWDTESWKLIKSHPKVGLNMLESAPNIPEEVRYMVYQHHEEAAGFGYPNGLRASVIFPLAKLVAVADAFAEMISQRGQSEAYTVAEAVQELQNQFNRFDREILAVLPRVFLGGKKTTKQAA